MLVKAIQHSFAVFILSSCQLHDPSDTNLAPPCYSMSWAGPRAPSYINKIADEEADEQLPDRKLDAQDIVDIALRKNPLTQSTWFNARTLAYKYRASKGQLLPQVDLIGTYAYSYFGNKNNVVANGTGDGFLVLNQKDSTTILSDLTINYLLLDFGGRSASIDSAKHALYAANWAHNRQVQQVIVDSLTNYYNYMSQRALVDARIKDLQDAQRAADASQKQYEVGIVAKKDLLLAQSTYVSAKLNLETQNGLKKTSMARLATSLGLAADNELSIIEPPDKLPGNIKEDMQKLLELAKSARPDLQASYASMVGSWNNLQQVFSASMPVISSFGNFESFVDIRNTGSSNRTWEAGITLGVPIFHGFTDYNNIKAARELVDFAWANYRGLELQVLLDVAISYVAFETSFANVENSIEFLKFAEESYEVSYNSYLEGVATILDLLSAQAVLSRARSEYIQARTNLMVSLVAMAYSTGILY